MRKQEILQLGYDYCYYVCSEYNIQSKTLKAFMKVNSIIDEDCNSTYNPFKENSNNYKWFGHGFTKAYTEIKQYTNAIDDFSDDPNIEGSYDMLWAYEGANQGPMENAKVTKLISKYLEGLSAILEAGKLIKKNEVDFDCWFTNPYAKLNGM